MRIERIAAPAASGEHQAPRAQTHARPPDAQGDGRAPGQARGKTLVALNSPQARAEHMSAASARTVTPFIAQLLANRMGLAQTRERRRLAADEASLRYCAANDLDAWPALDRRQARSI